MEALKTEQLFSESDPIWKRKPFVHQTEMARFHYGRLNSLDLSEVGTGKTPGMIAIIRRLIERKSISRVLVIATNTILDNWGQELRAWSDLSYTILRGPKDKRIALLQQSKIADVYLINYEGLRVVFPQLMAMNFDMIVCDEIHHIKSHQGSRKSPTQSFLARELARGARSRKGMTGTVLTNNLEDLWAICQFIDPSIFKGNFWSFRNRFMYNENAGKPWLKFPKFLPRDGAVDEIKKLLEPHAIRFEKREVLKFLPPVLFQKRTVTLSSEQRRVYSDLKRHFVAELNESEEIAVPHVLSRVTKLLEIASGFVYKEEGAAYRFEGAANAKLSELREVLAEIGDKKVVIWCAFKEDANLVAQLLISMGKSERFAFIMGSTRQEQRQDIVDVFNRDGRQYLICNASCAGEGLSIYTPYSVYYSRSWKLGERLQSLGRHDRPGSERFDNVTVIDIVAGDTVDEEVMGALDRKEDLLQTINPESFRRMLG